MIGSCTSCCSGTSLTVETARQAGVAHAPAAPQPASAQASGITSGASAETRSSAGVLDALLALGGGR